MIQSYVNHMSTVKKYHDAGLLSQETWNNHIISMSFIMNSLGGHWVLERITVTTDLRSEFKKHKHAMREDGFWAVTADS